VGKLKKGLKNTDGRKLGREEEGNRIQGDEDKENFYQRQGRNRKGSSNQDMVCSLKRPGASRRRLKKAVPKKERKKGFLKRFD